MKAGRHSNYKVQSAYNNYGTPDLIILETCGIHSLSDNEIYWCKEFNALGPSGLCIIEPGVSGGYGSLNSNSKYPKCKILKVFSYLYKGNFSIPKISQTLNVPKSLVSDICIGNTHTWLSTEYTEQYQEMRKLDRSSILEKNKPLRGILQSPEGALIEIYSIALFCKNHFNRSDKGIRSSVSACLLGKRKSCCGGYTLYKGV
jgi:hypothetical protein